MDLDFHVITPAGPRYICSKVGGRAVIPPPPAAPTLETPFPVEAAQHSEQLDEVFDSA